MGDAYDQPICAMGYTEGTDGSCMCYTGVYNADGSCGDAQPVVNGIVQPIGTAPTAAACTGLFYGGSPGTGLGTCVGPIDLGTLLLAVGAWFMFKDK
jgi:hypothetical protein